ncbi:MAG: hypothetical protein KKA60_11585 [Proteobacteria bacterium]|nr:hypothetical protein [Pseudomonadota bacterium]
MSRWNQLRKTVEDLVNKGVTSVEEIHKKIADMPFSRLEEIAPLQDTAKSVHDIHDKTVGGIYETIRLVNKKVGEFAEEILDGVDNVKDDGENY